MSKFSHERAASIIAEWRYPLPLAAIEISTNLFDCSAVTGFGDLTQSPVISGDLRLWKRQPVAFFVFYF
jgi:hypothetical protein